MLVDLMTNRGEELLSAQETPWTVYPRPQMRRGSYLNLNGQWDFCVTKDPWLPGKYDSEIAVPFCMESALSGVKKQHKSWEYIYYRRKFTLPDGFNRGRVLLHIGAADRHLKCYVNGKRVGTEHDGGYDNITYDVTRCLQAENILELRCYDPIGEKTIAYWMKHCTRYPYGKQVAYDKRGGMWYTPVSGIWQTVWLESVPKKYIHKLNIENRGYSVCISIEPKLSGRVIIPALGEFELTDGAVTVTPENPNLWSPENPHLYDFTVKTEEDEVHSYFAIRSLEVKKVGDYPRLCLNGKPYFFHGLLDQGYWPDGIFTPAKPECYADDILAMKRLGFNTLRKHIKVEPEEFYYQCDKLGMIVWQDMVNNGDYNYIRDTVMPTIGVQKRDDRNFHRDKAVRKAFLDGMAATVGQLKNHPCICYWTIFNEGWGQFDSDNVYEAFKKLDDTRFIDTTSGWFRRKKTDVDSRHVYFGRLKLRGDGKKPLVLSEFGGRTYRAEGHVFNPDKTYGYGGCESLQSLSEAVSTLYMQEVLPCVEKGLCATVYTQVSDVEDEINGLLSYDRKVEKLTPETMLPIAAALQKAVESERLEVGI